MTLDIPFSVCLPLANADIVNASGWVTLPEVNDPMMQNITIPADAAVKGMWSDIKPWPLNGLHAAILPDGRVLSYGTTPDGVKQNGRYFDIWDPKLGFGVESHQTSYRPQQQDSFCSASTYLPDGKLLLSGGNGKATSTLFNPSTNEVSTLSSNLSLVRWYGTMITLPDGRPLMMGGMVPYSSGPIMDNPDLSIAQGLPSMTPEILDSTGWRSLFGAYSREVFGPDYLKIYYPRAFVAPNGLVFGITADKMWYLDVNNFGSVQVVGSFKVPYSSTTPVNVGSMNNVVMYDIGKLLVVGGNGGYPLDNLPASNMATTIDINNTQPVLSEQLPMKYARRMHNSIVLANGQVVVTGGSSLGDKNGSHAIYAAEIWDSLNGKWTLGASAATYRGYHSNTALLPNGTILSTGGGTPGPVVNLNAEIYYPPYLFKSVNGSSQLAARPVIKAISGLSYSHDTPIQIDMANQNPISKLVLLGLSRGTHDFNVGQRRIPLAFTQQSYRLSANIPNANIAPPGYYQVVAIDQYGVPSLGAIIGIGPSLAAPNTSTSTYNPPDVSGTINAQTLAIGATASYTVTPTTGSQYSWDFGDGTPTSALSSNPAITHRYQAPGVYIVTLTAIAADGAISRRTFVQAVATTHTDLSPRSSTTIMLEPRQGMTSRVWVVNPDNNSVAVLDAGTNQLQAEIAVGELPKSIALAPDGRIWVVNKNSASISIISPATLSVVQTIKLPRASQPHGLVFSASGSRAFVVLEASAKLFKMDALTGAVLASLPIANNSRELAISASPDAANLYVSRFITPPLPGESTATVDTSRVGAELQVVNPKLMSLTKTISLWHSDKTDDEIQGSGIPNYLGAPAISPDGHYAWVPSKQDNIKRGVLRNGQNLNFQNTVRAISSRINLTTLQEELTKRIDHDNSSLASAALYHPNGVYMFVALETSRQVAVVDALGGRELFRFDSGRAPQGLMLSQDGNTLYVQDYMDRTVTVFDLTPLTIEGKLSVKLKTYVSTVQKEKLSPNVLAGKQMFYDARDPRLARDSYMSCASCHRDGGHDGRVWDLTGLGEGLRNTIALNGRAGMGHGFLHWSGNMDEVQDFEKQIRDLAGGNGLMTDEQYSTGTRNQVLGDKKAGISDDLDNLAAYVSSLNTFAKSPYRNTDGTLTTAAIAGKNVFEKNACASCHGGLRFTNSADATALKSIGTINAMSGKRLGAPLTGIDAPTLRDVWATAPYLHNGSALTLDAAVAAHQGVSLSPQEMSDLVAYLQQIGSEEPIAAGTGTGLAGQYFNQTNFGGSVVLQRNEAINFDWGLSAPDALVPADKFSVRWKGKVEAAATGAYQFRTNSDDSVRVWVNGKLVIANWTAHLPMLNTTGNITLAAGQRYDIVVEYQDISNAAVMQLMWKVPGETVYAPIPVSCLYQ